MEDGYEGIAKFFELQVKMAIDHKVPVDKFGRYPTRNQAMGRVNTAAETEYLKNAEGWGQ